MNPTTTKRLTTSEVARLAGIGKTTLIRWLKAGYIPEPDRDWRKWRAWTEDEAQAVARFANRIVPSPHKQQLELEPQVR